MALRRGGHGFNRGGQRRLTQWVGPADQGFINVASGGASIISSISFEEQTTAVRIRGDLTIIPQSSAADLTIVGAYGEGIVTQEAFAAGVASMPEPFTDGDWGGWMVWRSFSFRLEVGTDTTGFEFLPWDMEVDSKAMRKISPNEVLVAIAESQTGAFSISAPVRTLLKLS